MQHRYGNNTPSSVCRWSHTSRYNGKKKLERESGGNIIIFRARINFARRVCQQQAGSWLRGLPLSLLPLQQQLVPFAVMAEKRMMVGWRRGAQHQDLWYHCSICVSVASVRESYSSFTRRLMPLLASRSHIFGLRQVNFWQSHSLLPFLLYWALYFPPTSFLRPLANSS